MVPEAALGIFRWPQKRWLGDIKSVLGKSSWMASRALELLDGFRNVGGLLNGSRSSSGGFLDRLRSAGRKTLEWFQRGIFGWPQKRWLGDSSMALNFWGTLK
jgi:hypothetical protein